MIRISRLLALALFLAACGDSSERTEPAAGSLTGAGAVAYINANIWDGSGTAPLLNAILVVRDGRVERVSTDEAPAGAQIIDLGGAWVVPGFINAHGHVLGRWAADEVQGEAAMVEGDLALYARYGVTTVLSLGGAPAGAFGIRSAQQGQIGRAHV